MLKKILTGLCLFLSINVFANIGPQGFHWHLNKHFVETGSYGGNGIQKAINA